MTFPINYNYNNLDEARELSDLVERKFESIEKYLSDKGSISCDVEFSKLSSHQSGEIHHMEANLRVDGGLYRAEATEESFEKAIDKVRAELDVELRRAKGKQEALDKKEGREMKEKMLEGE